jgi:succinoglycan biosynthesis transport protein ExoP
MDQKNLRPLDYLTILNRRKFWFGVPLVACTALGIGLATLLPPTYRSSATIGVQAPAVVLDLVPAPRGGLNRDERLQALSQQLRSPAVIDRVAQEEGLAVDKPMDVVRKDLLTRITVEIPRSIARNQGELEMNSFDIVYRDRTAALARRITDRLANVFSEEHSRSREVQAEETAEFLATQVAASQGRLSTLEKQLRTAKERYMGGLPEQTLANLQTIAGVRQQLEATQNSIVSERDRLTLTERQTASMKKLGSSSLSGSSRGQSPRQRVATLEEQLDEARSKYTQKHPEILLLEEELKAARAAATTASAQPVDQQALLETDPAYQRLRDESELTRLRIASLQRIERQLQGDLTRYQQRLDAAPMVEQAISSLQRDYELEAQTHKQLSERHSSALVQEQIARVRGGERFSVLTAASLPDSPESPNRARILLMALALGLALGGGLAFAREMFDESILDARTIQQEFNVPVLVEIPRIPGS